MWIDTQKAFYNFLFKIHLFRSNGMYQENIMDNKVTTKSAACMSLKIIKYTIEYKRILVSRRISH